MGFFQHLENTALSNNSLLCVGLDPRPEQFPADVLAADDPIFEFNKRIIDATRDLVCAYKPNYAFYEAQGINGLEALRKTIAYIGPGIPVILDAKRGDIGSTATAYAKAAFDVWGAGAVTLSPYLGGDSVVPFTEYADRGVFVLCHTSNPSASELQTLSCTPPGQYTSTPVTLYYTVARKALTWSQVGNVGLVIGGTYPAALQAIREIAPQTWFLVPGIGAQGGDLEATVTAGLRADGLGLVISSSRGICHATDPCAAASALREQINAAKRNRGVGKNPVSDSERLILELARIGAVRFGEFTLKSGKTSPIYIDLRLLASHPAVLSRVATAYADLLESLEFDRMAAIPYAALPIGTAVSLQTGIPIVYPRKETKSYGTKRAIEGVFEPGECVVVLDDLITTGGSKIEAIAPLQSAGLQVRDIVVLIDRENGGAGTLAQKGYQLHAVLTLHQILDVLAERGKISHKQRQTVLDWLTNS
ncbi:MAG: orotidine-5'-phosphate decarboxylase [Anaerolineae bacterium]|nr:orotidine-5'-phosphate decarboxylase [Anaerolineae bacterium]